MIISVGHCVLSIFADFASFFVFAQVEAVLRSGDRKTRTEGNEDETIDERYTM